MLAETFLPQLFCRESSTLLFWLCAEGGPGWEQLGKVFWILGTAEASDTPLSKELICKVWELMYRCTLVSA